MLEAGHVMRRQPSTPSSDDTEDPQLNMSTTDSCDYEIPPKILPSSSQAGAAQSRSGARSHARGGNRNAKQVTADARRILDRFLKMAEEISRHRERRRYQKSRYVEESARSQLSNKSEYDDYAGGGLVSETEHQYAIVEEIFHDLLPTPYQPMGSDEDEEAETKAAQQFVDNFKKLMSIESDYVDCQVLALTVAQNQKVKLDTAGSVSVKPRKTLRDSTTEPPPAVKRAVKQLTRPVGSTTRSKSRTGKAKKGKIKKERTEGDEDIVSSSSSTEDYEVPDVELLNRKKKSGFRLAIERVQQSFRRQIKAKDINTTSQDRSSDSSKFSKSDVPLPAIPLGHTSDVSETWFIDSEDRVMRGGVACEAGKRFREGDVIAMDLEGGSHGLMTDDGRQEGLRRKSPLPWTRRSIKEDEKVKDNGGLFEGIIRQFRKGSAKLRGKNNSRVGSHRCQSADNLSLRPLSKTSRKLLEQYRSNDEPTNVTSLKTCAGKNREQDAAYDTDCSLARKRCPVDLATPKLLRGSLRGHQSLRQKMSLEGLMPCRPRGQTEVKVADEGFKGVSRRHCERMDVQDGGRSTKSGRQDEIIDYIDSSGPTDLLDDLLDSSKPFSEKSEQEKEELFERIAEQLAAIADRYCFESPLASPGPASAGGRRVAAAAAADCDTAAASCCKASVTLQTSSCDLKTGDTHSLSVTRAQSSVTYQRQASQASDISSPTLPAAAELVQTTSYGKFEEIVNANVGAGDSSGDQTVLQQIARTFRLTQSAVQLAGVQAEVVRQIKDMTLRYFEDRFADWIVGQGGWESMVEDGNTDKDSELD